MIRSVSSLPVGRHTGMDFNRRSALILHRVGRALFACILSRAFSKIKASD